MIRPSSHLFNGNLHPASQPLLKARTGQSPQLSTKLVETEQAGFSSLGHSITERLSLVVEEVAVLSDGLRQIERLVFEIQPKTKWETTTTKKRKSVFSSCLRGPTNKGKNTNNLMKEQEDEEDGDPLKNTPQLPGQDEEEEEEEEGEQEEEEDRFYLAARVLSCPLTCWIRFLKCERFSFRHSQKRPGLWW